MATTRTTTAQQDGPIGIYAALLGAGGTVTVRADRAVRRAEITITTTDDTGPAADAVRAANLHQDRRGVLVAHVEAEAAGGTVVTSRHGSTVIQSVITGGIVAGQVFHNGRLVSGGAGAVSVSPIEIVALVPEGSAVTARTQSADVTTYGTLSGVSANTQSGDVSVGEADQVQANTQSGDVLLQSTKAANVHTMSGDVSLPEFSGGAQVSTMSGDIAVTAKAGGNLNLSTMSGNITVAATSEALAEGLIVNPSTMSGRIRVPR